MTSYAPSAPTIENSIGIDPLSEVLATVRLRCLFFRQNEFTAPWGLGVPGSGDAVAGGIKTVGFREDGKIASGRFYLITEGNCWLQTPSLVTPLALNSGDLAFIFDGRAHELRDDLYSSVAPSRQSKLQDEIAKGEAMRMGGGGALTTFTWGAFIVENRDDSRLLSALPPVLHVRVDEHRAISLLEATIKLIGHASAPPPGAQSIIDDVVHILFTQAIGAYTSRLPARGGTWLDAMLDPDIGPALGLIHSQPGKAWTVASLADAVAMSRSSFAARFATLVGEPPLRYLLNFRMAKATQLLGARQEVIKKVAESVGYDSEAAFSKAFKRVYGVSPGIYRKEEKCAARQQSEI